MRISIHAIGAAAVAAATLWAGVATAQICGSATTKLIAGQQHQAGDVTIQHDDTNLYITISTDGDWVMIESHVHVAESAEELPQNRAGNPMPGRFDHKRTHDPAVATYTYQLSLESLGLPVAGDGCVDRKLYIAVHAVVKRLDADGNTIQEETAWGRGPGFPGNNWAIDIEYDLTCCSDAGRLGHGVPR